MIYLKTNTRSTKIFPNLLAKLFDGKLLDAEQVQRCAAIGEEITTTARTKVVVLNTIMLHARSYHEAAAGNLSFSQAQKSFSAKEGFTLQHDHTNVTLTLSWQQVVVLSEDLLVFDQPLDGSQ